MTVTALETPLSDLLVIPVRDDETAGEYFKWLSGCNGPITIDTETTGTDWWDRCRMVQIGDANTVWLFAAGDARDIIKDIWDSERPLVMHNANFDIPHLLRTARMLSPANATKLAERTTDTMLLAHLLDPREKKVGGIGKGLKPLSDHYLGAESLDSQKTLLVRFRELGFKNKADGFKNIPLWDRIFCVYGGVDVALTARLYALLMPMVEANDQLALLEVERLSAGQTLAMACRGFRVDLDACERIGAELLADKEAHSATAAELGCLNVNATKQVAVALAARGHRLTKLTDKGNLSVDSDVLRSIDDPLADAILGAKQAGNFKSTFIDNFVKHANVDGRIHCRINNFETRTGRMSSSEPNLQNLPSNDFRIRSCLIADEGHLIGTIDYSNIELRVAAYYSQEPKLISAFKENRDVHDETADKLFGSPHSKAQRAIGKTTNFTCLYSGGPNALSKNAGIPLLEAKAAITAFRIAYPALNLWSRNQMKMAQATGQPARTIAGQVLPVDHGKEYKISNHIIQSTAASILKSALVQLSSTPAANGLLLPVHDEFVFQFPKEEIEEQIQAITTSMSGNLGEIPIAVDAEIAGSSWGEKYAP
jgi:DNA polymerase-1